MNLRMDGLGAWPATGLEGKDQAGAAALAGALILLRAVAHVLQLTVSRTEARRSSPGSGGVHQEGPEDIF